MPTSTDILEDSRKEDETLDALHAALPDHVDRRAFFKGALGVITGVGLAGCTGGGGSGGGSTGGGGGGSSGGGSGGGSGGSSDVMGYPGGFDNVAFRNSYKDQPYESHGYIARGKGFWEDAGIKPPVVKTGQGSGYATQLIGTDKEEFGIANIQAQIQGQAKGYTHKVLCGAKAERAFLALLHRKDMMPSHEPEDIKGKTILVASAFDQQTVSLYLELKGLTKDDVTIKVAENASQFALVSQKKGAAMWGQITQVKKLQDAVAPAEVGVDVFYNYKPIYGYMVGASDKLLSAQNGEEYATRLIEGLSAAGKWAMFNVDGVIEYMTENVNSALQTASKEQLRAQCYSSLVGPCLVPEVVTEGVFFINKDVMKETYDFTANAYGVDPPSHEEGVRYDLQENAELTKLSKSEYEEAFELGQPYTGYYGHR